MSTGAVHMQIARIGYEAGRLHLPVAWVKPSLGRLALICIAVGAAIEALLAVRLWAELFDETSRGGLTGLALDASRVLVSPFRTWEGAAVQRTGVFDLSTLYALEFYLVAMLGMLLLLFICQMTLITVRRFSQRVQRMPSSSAPVPEVLEMPTPAG